MSKLNAVSYRIAATAAPLCTHTAAGTGLSIDFIGAYDPQAREAIKSLLKMGELPQIAAVAPDSPAQAAGIEAGDTLISIDGSLTEQLLAESREPALFSDELEERLARQQPGRSVALRIRRSDREIDIALTPIQICKAHYIIKTGKGISAYTDGYNIAISSNLIEFTQSLDELALIIGHETAHIIFSDGNADSLGQRRFMEDRADVVGTRLMICAGYDIRQATNYWRRRDATDWLKWFRDPTHRSRAARIEIMLNEARTATCPPSTEHVQPTYRH